MKIIESNNKILAVILTGGLSSRMGGGIKSFKKFNDKTIFDRILENINKQVDQIIINNNKNSQLFLKYNTTIVEDIFGNFAGPLAGIHSALSWIKKNNNNVKWLITVPGDTPFIPKNLVQILLNSAVEGDYEIVLAKSSGKTHPIIGIWRTYLHESLDKDLNAGIRKIMIWAQKHRLGYAKFEGYNYDPFFNINYNEDINKAEEIEKNYF
tara:strand:- start:212 stop:841 length:630 start_codon:yes stop_codon:yes gene_type:complete